jgi:hypothetical protein
VAPFSTLLALAQLCNVKNGTYFAWDANPFVFIAEAMSSTEDESVEIQTNRWKIDSIKYDAVAKSKTYRAQNLTNIFQYSVERTYG